MIKRLIIKNLGPIKEADILFGNLTIICGKNSVGKTYLSYTHYLLTSIFFDSFRSSIKYPELEAWIKNNYTDDFSKFTFTLNIDDIKINTNKIINELKSTETAVFLANSLELNSTPLPEIDVEIDNDFLDRVSKGKGGINAFISEINVSIEKPADENLFRIDITRDESAPSTSNKKIIDDISNVLSYFICRRLLSHAQFAITSERTGISLFYNDLDSSLRKSIIDFGYKNKDQSAPKNIYIKPIEDNIATIRSLSHERNFFRISNGNKKNLDTVKIMRDLIGGKYKSEEKTIKFIPENRDNVVVSLKSSSGAAKSMLLLDHFVTKLQTMNGLLIIDEPEMNLHLDNQKKMAHLLAALSNNGVRVVVTTHSDHFVREINNLVMLSSPKIDRKSKSELLKKANIKDVSILRPESVSTVVIESGPRKTKAMTISELGIDLTLFNDEIIKSIDIANEISMAIYEGS
ncbi:MULTISPECIES: AAA family ATPase [Aeromonas]|uniref:ATP-binding protein n=1 Tax=Aeromonas bestiarum TaxID=105751 RepID=A0ABT7Q135_9GAMM|nr:MULTISPECIES: AAA family ATPase [Aeromonas]MCH7348479.1 ATP-binding protein [Aeromonas sp. MR7]MDM5073042.1 ATP-binding protein [Aeromonas bestiarum]